MIKESVRITANLITVARVFACLAVFIIAFNNCDQSLNLLGLFIFWGLDVLDGYLARLLDQETIFGAQLDILADRLLIILFYMNFLSLEPSKFTLVAIFLFQFVFLDSYLSFQFLNWDIISSNYFFQVDSIIWQLNWPLPVKFMNSGLATIILVFTDLTAIALLLEFRQFSKTRKSQIAHLHLNNHISSR